jgi:hypothetical protein
MDIRLHMLEYISIYIYIIFINIIKNIRYEDRSWRNVSAVGCNRFEADIWLSCYTKPTIEVCCCRFLSLVLQETARILSMRPSGNPPENLHSHAAISYLPSVMRGEIQSDWPCAIGLFDAHTRWNPGPGEVLANRLQVRDLDHAKRGEQCMAPAQL